MNLFGENEFIPKDETDLAEYILANFPGSKESQREFKERWYHFLATKANNGNDFIKLLMDFDIIGGVRRRQEKVKDSVL